MPTHLSFTPPFRIFYRPNVSYQRNSMKLYHNNICTAFSWQYSIHSCHFIYQNQLSAKHPNKKKNLFSLFRIHGMCQITPISLTVPKIQHMILHIGTVLTNSQVNKNHSPSSPLQTRPNLTYSPSTPKKFFAKSAELR